MKIAVRTLLAAAALATIVRLPAQEAKRTLSLDEAIAVALTENPAMKAAEFEEKAATQERRAAIGLRMPKISVMGAYAYMSKDIGFDFNEMKGPAKELAGQILGSGLIPPEMIPSINGLLNPLMNADWFLKVQDQSLGFVGGRGLGAHLAGRQDQRRQPRRQDQRTHGGGAGQPDPQCADFGARGALLRAGTRHAGRRGAPAGGRRRTPPPRRCRRARKERHDRPERTPLRRIQDGGGRARAGQCRIAGSKPSPVP